MARHWPARWTTAPVAVAGSIDDHCRYLTALRAAPGQAFHRSGSAVAARLSIAVSLTTNQCGPGHRSGVSDAPPSPPCRSGNRRTPVTCEGFHDCCFHLRGTGRLGGAACEHHLNIRAGGLGGDRRLIRVRHRVTKEARRKPASRQRRQAATLALAHAASSVSRLPPQSQPRCSCSRPLLSCGAPQRGILVLWRAVNDGNRMRAYLARCECSYDQ